MKRFIPGVSLVEVACGVGALLVILLFAWYFITEPARERDKAAAARAAAMTAQGQVLAGKDAIGIITAGAERDDTTDETSRDNADAISKAPGARAPVDPGLARTGRNGLCQYAAYRNTAECVQLAHPR